MVRIILALIALSIIAVAAAFSFLNARTIELDLFVTSISIGLPPLLFICLLLGWILGLISVTGPLLRGAAERRRLREQARLAEQELDNLRKLPLRDGDRDAL